MNLIIWQYIVWGILALIILGVLALIFAMYNDYRKGQQRNVDTALPDLKPVEKKYHEEVFAETPDRLVEGQSRSSRRSLRNNKSATKDYREDNAQKSSSFFDDDGEEFSLTSGKD